MLSLRAANRPGAAPLNEGCGAEYLQKQRLAPRRLAYADLGAPNVRCCAFDGDADRVVYCYHRFAGGFRILDGDKIACLLATFVKKELQAATPLLATTPSLGVVQTAYANGAAAKYLKGKGIAVTYAKTGVKYARRPRRNRARRSFRRGHPRGRRPSVLRSFRRGHPR